MQAIGKGDAVTLKPKMFSQILIRRIYFYLVVVVIVVACDPVELRRGLSIMADTEFVAMVSGIVDVSKKA